MLKFSFLITLLEYIRSHCHFFCASVETVRKNIQKVGKEDYKGSETNRKSREFGAFHIFQMNFNISQNRNPLLFLPDKEPPVITGTDTVIVPTDHGMPYAIVTWTEPTVEDNSGLKTLLVSSHSPGAPFYIGSSSVTYSATDSSGTVATFTLSITVKGMILDFL